MIPFNIDISDIIEEVSAIGDEAENLQSYIVDKIADNYMVEWEAMINAELKSTRNEYIKPIVREKEGNSTVVIGLVPRESNLALMIEDGASQFDIKEGFKNSKKRKDKDDGGWYLTVPFRYATSEALGESEIFKGKLPKVIEKKAKTKQSALIMQDLPKQYQKLGINKTTGYEHKAPIYLGVQRQDISSTKKEKRGGYVSFRRVSDLSDEQSWVHPGFTAKKLMEKAMSKVDSNLDLLLDQAVDEYLKNRL